MALFGTSSAFVIPNPDPDWHYFWCLENPPNALIEYLQFGYELVVGKDECDKLFGKGTSDFLMTPSGRIRKGDSVLLKLPMKRYENEVLAVEQRKAGEELDRIAAGFHNSIDRLGVRGITSYQQSMEEYTDTRAHATRESVNRVGYTGPAKR